MKASRAAGIGCLGLVALAAIGQLLTPTAGRLNVPGATPSDAPVVEAPDPVRAYRDSLALELDAWERGGFDNVLLADLRLTNNGGRDVKDVGVRCATFGESGTELSHPEKTIFQVFPAGKTTRLRRVNLGLIHSQSARARCRVAGFSF